MGQIGGVVLLIICILHVNSLDDSPSIASQNGNLIIKAPGDRDITFSTSGKGRVLINGVQLGNNTYTGRNGSIISDRVPNGFIDTSDNYFKIQEYVNTAVGRLESSANSTRMLLDFRVRFLQRRISTLTRKVNNINRFLNKDECLDEPCKNGGTCQDGYKKFMCHCTKEWEGPTCEKDVNECAIYAGTDLGCQNGASCFNTAGNYECLCPAGWFGPHCTKRNADCSTGGTELCVHGTCVADSSTAGYKCICDQGWTTDGKHPACNVDVNECELNHPHCSVNPRVPCINVPGSFYCGNCPEGYTGNGYYCVDIDECAIFNGGCSIAPIVQCVNVPGSRLCGTCPPGYSGNGVTCTFQGMCYVDNGGCHPVAQCQHGTSGLVTCTCPSGYVGNGVGPRGCTYNFQQTDPCIPNPCKNGLCNSTYNQYVCTCSPSYTGRNCDVKINYCDPNPCLNGGTCHQWSSSYTCRCTSEYTGTVCQEQREACGGQLHGEEGVFKYPMLTSVYKHKLSCAWVIETNNTQVLNVTFTKFKLEESQECSNDFLQIHDGRSAAANILGRFCGNKFPLNGTIISAHNAMYFWFRSDESEASDGFEFTWNTIPPVCGGIIDVTSHGSISSPGSPGNYPPNRDCYWMLVAPEKKRILFNFYQLNIGNNADCAADYLEFSATYGEGVFVKFCNTSNPEPLHSTDRFVTVHFHSDSTENYPGFQITYSVITGIPGCGGVFTTPEGVIRSPGHDNYAPSLLCEYQIKLPVDNKIKIKFEMLSVEGEDDEQCSFDHVSIYEGSSITNLNLVGRYCGTKLPGPYVSVKNELLIVFKSDETVNGEGFRISYETVCGNQYTSPTGILVSPGYPQQYPSNKNCIYEIIQPLGKIIILQFLDFDFEYLTVSVGDCSFDYVEIRDGSSIEAPLIGRYCRTPPVMVSTYNHLWINFVTDSSMQYRGFKANYTTNEVGCGGIVHATEKLQTIQSPKVPEVGDEFFCKWIVVAPAGYIIQLIWISFNLENSYNCDYDYVEIYDNVTWTYTNGSLMGRYCGSTKPPSTMSTSNIITVLYKLDQSISLDGFLVTFITIKENEACNGNYVSPTGTLRSPKYPDSYPNSLVCEWSIAVSNGQQIMLNVTHFQLEEADGCAYDSLEIRNGGTVHSPSLGKYCGTKIPKLISSHTNRLYFRFVSDYTTELSGFEIRWSTVSTGCGGTHTSSSGMIISPNYPEPYGQNTECFWKISVNMGSKIKLNFIDVDLEEHSTCSNDYVQVFDGPNSLAKSLGKFCIRNVPSLVTSGNQAFIKFKSDISIEMRGFQMQYLTECNNKLTGFYGVIESPDYPNNYPGMLNCTWDIEAYRMNNISLSFSNFEVDDCDDYLNISYYSYNEYDYKLNGTYCRNKKPVNIEFFSDKVRLHFITDASFQSSGFRLEWKNKGCGGKLTRPRGTINSPEKNLNNNYGGTAECVWIIETEVGNNINLTFTDVETEQRYSYSSYLIKVVNGPDESYPELTSIYLESKTPWYLVSSGNVLYIHYAPQYPSESFKASYVAVPAKCGGKVNSPQGNILSPNYPKNYDKNETCEWLIEVEQNHLIEFEFKDVDLLSASNGCDKNYIKVYDGPGIGSPILAKVCGDNKPNSTIFSTNNNLLIEMKADEHITTKGFMASYKTACGSRIETDGSGTIEFSVPRHHLFTRNSNCTWTIISKDLGEHITLTISQFQTQEFCNFGIYSLELYDGEDTNTSLIGRYCNTTVPQPIISKGAALTINLVASRVGSFFATYSVMDSRCGDTFISERGTFTSPKYPGNYPGGIECEWTISVAQGNSVELSFKNFDILESDNCESDYLEVRRYSSSGEVVGIFCGNQIPNTIKNNGSLWLFFESKSLQKGDTPSARGFVAEFALVQSVNLYGPSGRIASPLYPQAMYYTNSYSWRITVQHGYHINLIVLELKPVYTGGVPMIYEGADDTAPMIFFPYQLELPKTLKISSNVVYISIPNTYVYGLKFLMEWTQEQSVNSTTTPKSKKVCGSDAIINLSNITMYNFTATGYKDTPQSNAKCEYVFYTDPGYHLSVDFEQIHTFTFLNQCRHDVINLYVGKDNSQDWQLVSTFCGISPRSSYTNIPKSNYLKIELEARSFSNDTGFTATVYKECGGTLTESSGEIEVNQNSLFNVKALMTECEWNITVKPGRTIQVNFEEFNMGEDGVPCRNYIMLRNGLLPDSPLLGNGKYCGEEYHAIPETTGNYLSIKYYGRKKLTSFKLQYSEGTNSCGGRITLSDVFESTYISSPNYPNIPQPRTECIWTIYAPTGENIRLDFVERFDLTRGYLCGPEAVEIRDGGTELSPLIGQFCNKMPSTQISTDRAMFVKFFTNVDDPRNGFKAKVSVGQCGGTIRGWEGEINFPLAREETPFTKNSECRWKLVGPKGHFLNITLAKYQLETCNNRINITETLVLNETSEYTTVLGSFCGNNARVQRILSSNNEVDVIFNIGEWKSDINFRLQFKADREECGGTLSTSSGVIRPPGYPVMKYDRIICEWKIVVPKGRRITLELLDFDLDTGADGYEQFISFSSDRRHFMTMLSPHDTTRVIESADNILNVLFVSTYPSKHRGFEAKYTSDKPSLCLGNFSEESGVLWQPLNLSYYACTWERFKSDYEATNRTLVLQAQFYSSLPSNRQNCSTSNTVLVYSDALPILYLCRGVGNPLDIQVPDSSDLIIHAVQGERWSKLNFTITYNTYPCGGKFEAGEGTIESPGYRNKSQRTMECSWLLRQDLGNSIKVHFEDFNLGSDCSASFINIYNGPSRNSPKIGTYCNEQKPDNITSQSAGVLVVYHALNSDGVGFKMNYESLVHGCGGIYHDNTKVIESPGYPNNYPNNSECLWDINVENGYYVVLDFLGRFHLEQSDNCVKDYIEVWDWKDNQWHSLGRKCGRILPQPFRSTGNKMKILFRSNNVTAGHGFKAKWHTDCGGEFQADAKENIIVSPGYPKQYPSDVSCVYKIKSTETISLVFDDFELEKGSSTCKYDNLTIQGLTRFSYPQRTFCIQTPPPMRARGGFLITFKTDLFTSLRGFKFRYYTKTCGGNITSPTEIQFSGGNDEFQYNIHDFVSCIWNITAPPTQIVLLNIEELQTGYTGQCFGDNLRISEGNQTLNKQILKLCGKVNEVPEIRSKTNQMLVALSVRVMMWSHGRWGGSMGYSRLGTVPKFKADVYFTYGPTAGCGGIINLTLSDEETITPPSLRQLDCYWEIVASKEDMINIDVEKVILPKCAGYATSNCSCSYLELRNGQSQFSDLIKKVCNDTGKFTYRTSEPFAFIRFYSQGSAIGSSISIKVSKQIPVCGSTNITASEKKVVITSPGYPDSYPTNTRCTWVISKDMHVSMSLKFLNLNLVERSKSEIDQNVCNSDKIQITQQLLHSPGNEVSGINPLIIYGTGAFTPSVTEFCGTETPEFIYHFKYGRKVAITFISTSVETGGRGFKLEFATTGCNNNYTERQGLIVGETVYNGDCYANITVPKNRTISLYFMNFRFPSSEKCERAGLTVYDENANTSTGSAMDKICGNTNPLPIFSSGNTLSLKFTSQGLYISYAITYTSTDQGKGCGGDIYNYLGKFTSPLYPNGYRYDKTCTWNISVPSKLRIALKFSVFNFQGDCTNNYVQVTTTENGSENIHKFCQKDEPAVLYSNGKMTVTYKTTLWNTGAGWIANFQSYSEGQEIYWSF